MCRVRRRLLCAYRGPVTLVEDLIRDATASAVPVEDLPRRLKVIAARSKTAELAAWVGHELLGYHASPELIPSYRGPFAVPALGHFLGPFGSERKNEAIAPAAFPKEYRDGPLFNITFADSVAGLTDHARIDEKAIRAAWPADALVLVEMLKREGTLNMDPMYSLIQGYRAIPRSMLIGVLDSVRNRILDLALSFEEIAPDAGESRATPEESARMSQVFNTYVYGGQAAVGSTNVHQVQVNRSDEDTLLAALAAVGVDPDSMEELKKALAEDREDNGGNDPAKPGRAVSSWLGRLSLRAATAGGTVAVGAGGNVVSQLIMSYFGMG